MTEKIQLILVAGGLGKRLGLLQPKALAPLAGFPLLIHTLNAFRRAELHENAVVVYPEGHEEAFTEALEAGFHSEGVQLVMGGRERSDSVACGLKAISADTDIVMIHDAARPFIQAGTIHAAVNAAVKFGAATVAVPCSDTILRGSDDSFLEVTPTRSELWHCQTPQVFHRDIIEKAYASVPLPDSTDDASLVHETGVAVKIVEGTDTNMKITTPNDLQYAAFLLSKGLV